MQTPTDPKSTEMRRRRFRPIPVRMLVPNVITLLAICAGLTAIRLSTEGRMELAVAAIVFAAVLDGVDGRVARMIKGQSKFGAELDSLADFVNFGVAPGLILYFWTLHDLNNVGWIAAMVFAISGGLRLARFNATMDDPNKPAFAANFFTGVPAPAGRVTGAAADLSRVLGRADAAGDADCVLYAADRIPDGVAPAGVFGQDRTPAGAAGNGAAGFRLGDLLRGAAGRLSLAHSVGGLGPLSPQPAMGLEVVSRPSASRRGAGGSSPADSEPRQIPPRRRSSRRSPSRKRMTVPPG